MNLLKEER